MAIVAFIIAVILVPGILVFRGIMTRGNPFKTVIEAFIGASLGLLLLFIYFDITGEGLGIRLALIMKETFELLLKDQTIMSNPALKSQNPEELVQALELFYRGIINSLPAFLLVIDALSSYGQYKIISKMIGFNRRGIKRLPSFMYFSWPRQGSWILLLMFALTYIIYIMNSTMGLGHLLLINVNFLMKFYFGVQGASLLFYFVYNKRWPSFTAPLITVAMSLTYVTRVMLFVLGLFDLIMNLKARMEQTVG